MGLRIRVYIHQCEVLNTKAGFFVGFPSRTLQNRFADLLSPARERPPAIVCTLMTDECPRGITRTGFLPQDNHSGTGNKRLRPYRYRLAAAIAKGGKAYTCLLRDNLRADLVTRALREQRRLLVLRESLHKNQWPTTACDATCIDDCPTVSSARDALPIH